MVSAEKMIGASTATDYITAPQSPYSCSQRSGYIALRVSRQLESSQHLKDYFFTGSNLLTSSESSCSRVLPFPAPLIMKAQSDCI
jgi:hypothetical protein